MVGNKKLTASPATTLHFLSLDFYKKATLVDFICLALLDMLGGLNDERLGDLEKKKLGRFDGAVMGFFK